MTKRDCIPVPGKQFLLANSTKKKKSNEHKRVIVELRKYNAGGQVLSTYLSDRCFTSAQEYFTCTVASIMEGENQTVTEVISRSPEGCWRPSNRRPATKPA